MRIRLKLVQVVGIRVKRADGEPLGSQVLADVSHVDVGVEDGDVEVKAVVGCKLIKG
jgi:hypothetical protein